MNEELYIVHKYSTQNYACLQRGVHTKCSRKQRQEKCTKIQPTDAPLEN